MSMSKYFHAILEYYDYRIGQWKLLQLFRPPLNAETPNREVPLVEGDWNIISEILVSCAAFDYSDLNNAIMPVPYNLSKKAQVIINNLYDEETGELKSGYFGLHCVNVADLKIFTLTHPTIDEKIGVRTQTIPNPMNDLLNKISFFAQAYELDTHAPLSSFRIIYWGDC